MKRVKFNSEDRNISKHDDVTITLCTYNNNNIVTIAVRNARFKHGRGVCFYGHTYTLALIPVNRRP